MITLFYPGMFSLRNIYYLPLLGGASVGPFVGPSVGAPVGPSVGPSVGASVGDSVGSSDVVDPITFK